MTDSISRASTTMSKCVQAVLKQKQSKYSNQCDSYSEIKNFALVQFENSKQKMDVSFEILQNKTEICYFSLDVIKNVRLHYSLVLFFCRLCINNHVNSFVSLQKLFYFEHFHLKISYCALFSFFHFIFYHCSNLVILMFI